MRAHAACLGAVRIVLSVLLAGLVLVFVGRYVFIACGFSSSLVLFAHKAQGGLVVGWDDLRNGDYVNKHETHLCLTGSCNAW